MRTIYIARSARMIVNTSEGSLGLLISKETIWTTHRQFHIKARPTEIWCYKLPEFHCQRTGAVPKLSLHALYFQIGKIQPGPLRHHYPNAKSQHLTYYASQTLYSFRCSRLPTLVAFRIFLNIRPVDIRSFLNMKRLHLWLQNGSGRQSWSQRFSGNSFLTRSTRWLTKLGI